MEHECTTLRVTVTVSTADRWRHRPLYVELVHRAHRAGLVGATVFRGLPVESAAHRVFRALAVPMLVVLVDQEDRIFEFLDTANDLLVDRMVIVDRVTAVRHT